MSGPMTCGVQSPAGERDGAGADVGITRSFRPAGCAQVLRINSTPNQVRVTEQQEGEQRGTETGTRAPSGSSRGRGVTGN